MTKSATRIQDKDTQKRLSVVQSTEDPTKFGVVLLNPDGSRIKGPKGEQGDPATITVGSTTTGNPGTDASVVNSGTSSAAILDFTIPRGDKGDDGNPGNGIVNTTKQKVGKVTTVEFTYTNGDTFDFSVSDGEDGQGSGDVSGPSSSTDGDIALFDGATGKIIKDSGVNLSSKLDASALSNNNYGGAWENDSTHTPTKGVLYDKIHTMDVEIGNKAADNTVVKLTGNQTINGTKTFGTSPVVPSKTSDATNTGTAIATEAQVYNVAEDVATINGKIPSAATSSNQLTDKNYVDDSINSITAYYITKNAQGDQFATYAELSSATTFYSGGVVRVPTRNDYCIVQADENHDNATTRYIYQNNQWEYQYTVNETALTTAQLNALNSGITAEKVSTYDGYASTIAGKQNALATQTAYTTKGTATKVPTISTNTLGQVTAITETDITFPVTSVNGSTGAVTVNAVPSGGTNGDVLTNVSGTPTWQAPSGGDVVVSSQSGNILTTGTKLRAGTETDYGNLGTYDSNTIYLTIE